MGGPEVKALLRAIDMGMQIEPPDERLGAADFFHGVEFMYRLMKAMGAEK